jgi:glycerophosphoryl diester phosphodiesterase
MSEPLLLGHRGARATHSIPENTIASFDLALEHGCDGFEFDVRLTSDGAAVICHDPEFASLKIATSTYGELLHRWDTAGLPRLLYHERAGLPQEAIGLPCLEDVLAGYAGRAFLDIELKVTGLEDALLSALRRHPPGPGYVVSSFLPEVLLTLSARGATIPLGFLCDRQEHLVHWQELPIQYVIPNHRLTGLKLIEDAHAAGKKILVWTVNEREAMLRLAAWGADGIISDNTKLLVETLRKKGKLES